MVRYERSGFTDCILHVDHDLDVGSSAAITEMIRVAGKDVTGRVILSLEQCSYTDSTGVSALIRAHKTLGSRFIVAVPAASQCRRIFDLCGVSMVIRMVSTVSEALLADAGTSRAGDTRQTGT